MAEEEGLHRRTMDRHVVEKDTEFKKRGQHYALTISLVGLLCSAIIGIFGSPVVGSVVGGGTVVALVVAFIVKKRL